MDLDKARQICRDVADEAKRWGKHAGFAGYHQQDVLDALIICHKEGLFDLVGEKEARITANKGKGAAEARAKRAQNLLEAARKDLAACEKVIEKLEVRLKKTK